ncbi:hypothetical protein BCAR13_110167 [Paraburkholderia caribensis]|jgi:hypothetical protein|nr:hypothetical protein BCAR13_110167 [Paraburkholderia caribensis]
MDRQVTVFLYSIRRISSFTLSSSLRVSCERRKTALKRRNGRARGGKPFLYHYCVLKNEETLFLMMKPPG